MGQVQGRTAVVLKLGYPLDLMEPNTVEEGFVGIVISARSGVIQSWQMPSGSLELRGWCTSKVQPRRRRLFQVTNVTNLVTDSCSTGYCGGGTCYRQRFLGHVCSRARQGRWKPWLINPREWHASLEAAAPACPGVAHVGHLRDFTPRLLGTWSPPPIPLRLHGDMLPQFGESP